MFSAKTVVEKAMANPTVRTPSIFFMVFLLFKVLSISAILDAHEEKKVYITIFLFYRFRIIFIVNPVNLSYF